jgi:hypothetical protein
LFGQKNPSDKTTGSSNHDHGVLRSYLGFNMPSANADALHWSQFLRKIIEFIYDKQAVDLIHVGRELEVLNKQGKLVNEWVIYLSKNIDIKPVIPNLEIILKKINLNRADFGLKGVRIKVHSKEGMSIIE